MAKVMVKGGATARSDGPMALPRAFAVLRLLAEAPQGLNLSALANQTEAPKSSLSSTLKALTDQGFLTRAASLYFLGPEAYALASVVLAGRSIRQSARPFLEDAMQASGETVLLAAPDADGRHFTYVDIVESPKSVRYSVPVGARRPLYATSCGRLFLAWRSDAERRAYFDGVKLERLTEATITKRVALEKTLRDIRAAGISVTLGDYSADVAGFAAPVFNAAGEMIAALTIGVPLSRGLPDQDRFCRIAISAAGTLSATLGYKAA